MESQPNSEFSVLYKLCGCCHGKRDELRKYVPFLVLVVICDACASGFLLSDGFLTYYVLAIVRAVLLLVGATSAVYCTAAKHQRTSTTSTASEVLLDTTTNLTPSESGGVDEELERRRKAKSDEQGNKWKAVLCMSICFVAVTVESVYTGMRITTLGNVGALYAVPLTMTVFCMNLEFLLTKGLVEALITDEGLLLEAIHEHPLFYVPQVTLAICSSCRQRIGQKTGGYEAFSCKQCSGGNAQQAFNLCMNCYRKQMSKPGGRQDGIMRGDKGVKPPLDFSCRAYLRRAQELTAPFRLNFAGALMCTLLMKIADLLTPHYQGKLINQLIDKEEEVFYHCLQMFVVLQVISAFFGSIQSLTVQLVQRQINLAMRTNMFISLMKQDTAFFDATQTGQLTSRMTTDATAVIQPVAQIMNTAIPNLILLVGGFFMCFYTSWKLTILCFTLIGPVIYLTGVYAQWSKNNNLKIQSCNGDANAAATEALKNIRTVRCFGADDTEIGVFKGLLDQVWRYAKTDALFSAGVNTVNGYVNFAATVLVFVYGGASVLHGTDNQLSIGNLVTFNMYWNMLRNSMTSLNNMLNTVIVSTSSAKRVYEIIDLEPDIKLNDEAAIKIKKDANRAFKIEFRDVDFTYQTRPDKKLFDGLSFTIPAGTSCAFVGKSGMGKSTIIGLLLRNYDPQDGKIYLDGKPLENYNLRSFHQQIGIVSQETQVFARSVKENLTYGLPPDRYDNAAIEKAAKQANAHDFITKEVGGYGAMLAESGGNLSGGQKQRLSIARAFLRRPKLLLLDEATSALDTDNENKIQEALDDMVQSMQGECSVVMIAHRLSTVKKANKIVVINEGCVHEEGSHEFLTDRQQESFIGTYSDVNHPGCPRTIRYKAGSTTEVEISGHDGDPNTEWKGSGKVDKNCIVVDLSSKGGPADLEGQFTGTGIRWVKNGAEAIDNNESDDWTKALHFRTLTFEPGKMGIAYDNKDDKFCVTEVHTKGGTKQAKHKFNGKMGILCGDDGIVQEVIGNKPADTKGIKAGYKIVDVGTDPFSKKRLKQAENSGSDYEVRVQYIGTTFDADGQAQTMGIKKGNLIVKVNDQPCSEAALDEAEQSGSKYTVTFKVVHIYASLVEAAEKSKASATSNQEVAAKDNEEQLREQAKKPFKKWEWKVGREIKDKEERREWLKGRVRVFMNNALNGFDNSELEEALQAHYAGLMATNSDDEARSKMAATK